MRMYRVHFELFDDGEWQRNWAERYVAVDGGASEAITEAMRRERGSYSGKPPRLRVEAVELIAEES